ncbi:MAG TPA: DNA repair exonuclease, partial [Microthrixaceae bacterium]|nr:DNA repair exonuclease [Microthrixaceae bacterium]
MSHVLRMVDVVRSTASKPDQPSGRCFVHAADLHLGAPLASLDSRLSPDKAENIRRLSASSFDRLIQMTIDNGAAFIAIAGDVYDSAAREVSAQLRLHRGLERLHDEGIQTFIVHGNHDPVAGVYEPARRLPESVTVFEPGRVQSHRVELGDGSWAEVAGISYEKRAETKNLASMFATLRSEANSALIGLLHTNLGDAPGHGSYAPCSLADLNDSEVDYWALGHIHQRSVTRSGSKWVAYSGNLQGRSSKSSELGAKGALVVPVSSGQVGEPSFVACDGVRFDRRTVDVSATSDYGQAMDLMAQAAEESLAGAEGRPVLLSFELVGSTPIHDLLSRQSDDLVNDCREEFGSAMGAGEIMKVHVSTRNEVGVEQLLQRQDLLSAVLRHFLAAPRDPAGISELIDRANPDSRATRLV